MLRQKRTTVGLLTWARSASSATGRLAKLRGSVSTNLPTRCSAGARDGNEALMRSSMTDSGMDKSKPESYQKIWLLGYISWP